jgi:hypothetical protein
VVFLYALNFIENICKNIDIKHSNNYDCFIEENNMKNLIHKIITPKFMGYTKYAKLILIITLVLIGSFFGIIYFSEKPSVTIANGFLTIKSLFYGKSIPIGEINVVGIKQLNLNNDRNYNIKIRTNGIGLPNYHVGWMKLHNRNKALVYLTDKTNVVLIPTNDYDVLISTDDFTGITTALHKTIH